MNRFPLHMADGKNRLQKRGCAHRAPKHKDYIVPSVQPVPCSSFAVTRSDPEITNIESLVTINYTIVCVLNISDIQYNEKPKHSDYTSEFTVNKKRNS